MCWCKFNILQNGINFSKSAYRYYHFKFRVSLSQTARDFITKDELIPIYQNLIHWELSGLGAMH